MKKIFLLLSVILTIFSSCSNDEGSGGPSSIVLTADTAEGYVSDPINFLVMTNERRNVTNQATYFVNNVQISGNTYTPTEVGTIEVYATYGSGSSMLTSERITITIANSIRFNKRVLIEDFTGTWCGFCPRVSYAIEQVKSRTNDAVIVAIHRGNDPYNFAGAAELESQIGLTGYPTAMLNRNINWEYPETSNSSINQATDLTSGINPKLGIALETITTGNTSSVNVKIKFGRNFSNLKLVVYALEDNLFYDQTNYTTYFGGTSLISNFEHDHVLRGVLTTSILGENISGNMSFDQEFSKTFTYPIPSNVNSANVKFVAIVLDSSNRAINTREAGANENQVFEIE